MKKYKLSFIRTNGVKDTIIITCEPKDVYNMFESLASDWGTGETRWNIKKIQEL